MLKYKYIKSCHSNNYYLSSKWPNKLSFKTESSKKLTSHTTLSMTIFSISSSPVTLSLLKKDTWSILFVIFSGHGTYRIDNRIFSSLLGTVEITNKLIIVNALKNRYLPQTGDIVVGKVVEVFFCYKFRSPTKDGKSISTPLLLHTSVWTILIYLNKGKRTNKTSSTWEKQSKKAILLSLKYFLFYHKDPFNQPRQVLQRSYKNPKIR